MTNRCKWYKADFGGMQLEWIADSFRSMPYTDKHSRGFIIDEYRSENLSARYITKKIINNVLLSPFGDELHQSYVSYEVTRFRLLADGKWLEIYDAPRSSIEFFNQLSLATNFRISVSDIMTDVKIWTDNLKLNNPSLVNIISIECIDLMLGDNVKGSLSVSGGGDVEEKLNRFMGKTPYAIKSIKVELNKHPIVITSNSSASSSRGLSDFHFSMLRDGL